MPTALRAVDLTSDHKPERPDEKARIEASGGVVEPVLDERGQPAGPPRVWYLSQVAPGLAMTRSIGDAVGAMVGVTAEPEITERTLSAEDALLIIASDGVWEFLTSQQAVSFVSERLRGNAISEEAVSAVSAALADKARTFWLEEDAYVDDITVIVIVVQQSRASNDGGGANAQQGPHSRAGGRGGIAQASGNGTPTGGSNGAEPAPSAAPATGGPPTLSAGRYSTPRSSFPQQQPPPPSAPFDAHNVMSPQVAAAQGRSRMSVSAIGPAGKRGAVSGESATQMAGKGVPQLRRQSKPPERMRLILNAIKDPRHLIFQGMSEEACQAVAECMVEYKAAAGQDVIRQGEQGDVVYIVESGSYEVYLEQAGVTPVASYQSGDSFGELALMYSCARAATVRCVSPGILWGLDRLSYRAVIQQASDSANSSLMGMLKRVSIFAPLDAAQLSALCNSLQIVRCPAGTALLRNAPSSYQGPPRHYERLDWRQEELHVAAGGRRGGGGGGGRRRLLRMRSDGGGACLGGDARPANLAAPVAATGDHDGVVLACVLASHVTRDAFSRHVGALQDIITPIS